MKHLSLVLLVSLFGAFQNAAAEEIIHAKAEEISRLIIVMCQEARLLIQTIHAIDLEKKEEEVSRKSNIKKYNELNGLYLDEMKALYASIFVLKNYPNSIHSLAKDCNEITQIDDDRLVTEFKKVQEMIKVSAEWARKYGNPDSI